MTDFIHEKNFLDTTTRDEFWEFVRTSPKEWTDTTFEAGPSPRDIATTRTRYAIDLEPWTTVFVTLMARRSKDWFAALGIDETVSAGHARLNRNGANCHMGRHHDMGHGRKLTCIYYVHGQPRFRGGDLVLYGATTHRIPVIDNSVLVFAPATPHQVLPVHCGEAYEDGRFSMTVWLV